MVKVARVISPMAFRAWKVYFGQHPKAAAARCSRSVIL
jgi:hypothetical protein